MKAKVGISFAAGALAVGLAGTTLAAEPAAQQVQQVQPTPGYGAQQVRPSPGYGGQQVQPGLGQQVQPGPGYGVQQVHPGPDYGEPDWTYGQQGAVPTYPKGILPAPSKALEISVSGGYTQGFGDLSCEQGLGDVAGAGAGLGLNLSYRISPMFSVGIATQGQAFAPNKDLGPGAQVYGLTAGLDATMHLAPYSEVDPFISVGMGYRSLWSLLEGPQNDVQTHGFQLARLNVGVDMRVSKDVAVGPMIGADLTTFAWRNPIGEEPNERIRGMSVSTFLYAGLQGRFDVGGARTLPMK